RGLDACPGLAGRIGGYLVGGREGEEGLCHGLGGHLVGGFYGGGVFGYGVSGGLIGGGHDEAGGGQRRDRLVGGRLLHQPGRDQRLDGGGGSGRLDSLRFGHRLGRLGLGRSHSEH